MFKAIALSHRAMFKLGTNKLFLLCVLVKNMSAVYSTNRCSFSEEIMEGNNNLYKSWVERALNSGPFGRFRFVNHHFNWQILIKVWNSAIGLSCLISKILEYEKVRQIWTLLHGTVEKWVKNSWKEHNTLNQCKFGKAWVWVPQFRSM